jgi:hypothetical protein
MTSYLRRMTKAAGVFFALASLCACSSAGPGLAHHPLDCAIGIAWGDCLPGTPGYNGGGGQQTRTDEAKQEVTAINAQLQAEEARCARDLQSPDLEPLHDKVELFRPSYEAPPPFIIASNDTFPTDTERSAIAKWATIREECSKRRNAISSDRSSTDALSATLRQQDQFFMDEAFGRVGEIIIALYQAKMTYGEFAQKRYELIRSAAQAQRQFREAKLIAGQQRQAQAQQLAQQQFQNSLTAWSSYVQAVSIRQPQTIHLQANCTSQRFGTTINTNCY